MDNIEAIENACKELVKELPEDHGEEHSRLVARLSLGFLEILMVEMALAENTKELLRRICRLAAWIHDLNDKKMKNYVERWQRCQEILKGHPDAEAIEWIVGHVGVSREAGPNYTNKKYTAAQWEDELKTLGKLRNGLTQALVLMVRHCVSVADMSTAVGNGKAGGHTRTVEYNERKIREELGVCTIEELRKRVRAIHVAKHVNMMNWVHLDLPEVRELFAKGTRELIDEYNEWCMANGGTTEELIVM
jgi:hypothetical protein